MASRLSRERFKKESSVSKDIPLELGSEEREMPFRKVTAKGTGREVRDEVINTISTEVGNLDIFIF